MPKQITFDVLKNDKCIVSISETGQPLRFLRDDAPMGGFGYSLSPSQATVFDSLAKAQLAVKAAKLG